MRTCLSFSSSKVSNGETESVKTMIVHDEAESDTAITPSKDGTLIVRQVLEDPFLALFIVLCVLRFIIHPFLLFVLLMLFIFCFIFSLYTRKNGALAALRRYISKSQFIFCWPLCSLLFFLFFFPPLQLSIESAVPVFDSRA